MLWQREEKEREKLVEKFLNVSTVKDGEDLNNLTRESIVQIIGDVLKGECTTYTF